LNDLILVYAGSGIPTDGTVVYGQCTCDESMLTGESLPVSKLIGSSIYGGPNILKGSIIMKV
jgi:Cu+-exporting ATPase